MTGESLKSLVTARSSFVEDLKRKGRSSATILAYGHDIKQLINFLESQKITQTASVASAHLEAFKNQLFEKKYTPKSVSRKLNSVKTFFRFLKANKVIDQDPAKAISHPKLKVHPPRILNQMEYRALRDVVRDDPRLAAVVELLLQTGIRIGELSRLEMNDLTDKEILIKAFESHESRPVPLNQSARKALEKYLKVRPPAKTKRIFITKTGRPFLIRNIRTAINRCFRTAGIKNAKVNSLRHTFIAHQLKSGTSVTLVQKLIGHKRLSTTERYLQYIGSTESETVKLEEL